MIGIVFQLMLDGNATIFGCFCCVLTFRVAIVGAGVATGGYVLSKATCKTIEISIGIVMSNEMDCIDSIDLCFFFFAIFEREIFVVSRSFSKWSTNTSKLNLSSCSNSVIDLAPAMASDGLHPPHMKWGWEGFTKVFCWRVVWCEEI
jgi:hypothetical protein